MIRMYQTIQTNGVQNGNCFQACIASMMNVPLGTVPHFYENGELGGYVTPEENRRMQAWFKRRYAYYFETGYRTSIYTVLQMMGAENDALLYVLSGNTASGHAHSVVCRGGQIVHDPASESITDPIPYPCSDGYYRIGIIAKYL